MSLFLVFLRLVLCIFCIASLSGAPLLAEASIIDNSEINKWVKTGGPIGGLGYNIKIHPNDKDIMFVTDALSGVQKTINRGELWTASNNGIDARTGPSNDHIPVFSLEIDPHNPNIIWAGVQNQRGIFKSTNGGETWSRKDNGISEGDGLTIRNFGISPFDGNIVYASAELDVGVDGEEFARQKGVVYKTTNGGGFWSKIWEGDSLARWLCLSPMNPDIMFFTTGIFDREAFNINGEGILRSTDGGTTFLNANEGIDRSLFIGGMAMHPDPQKAGTAFIASGNNNDINKGIQGGVFFTDNAGLTWARVLPKSSLGVGSFEVFTAVAYAPSNPNVVYAGTAQAIFRSNDGGNNWTELRGKNDAPWGPPGIRSGVPIEITVDPDDPSVLYANNYGGGVFVSKDGAKTWSNLSNGYTGATLRGVAIDPQNSERVLVNGRSGPFRTEDGGVNFLGLAFGNASFAEGLGVAIHPVNPNLIFVSDAHEGFILRSTDSGLSWDKVFDHPSARGGDVSNRHGALDIRISPADPDLIYAGFTVDGLFSDPYNNTFSNSLGVYKSSDAGKTWNVKNSGLSSTNLNITALALSKTDENKLYIGLRGGGVYKSEDGASTWQDISAGLPSNSAVFALAVSPLDDDVVFAGTRDDGVYKSLDGGDSWAQVLDSSAPLGGTDPKLIRAIAVDPSDDQKVYVAGWNYGLYSSDDGGSTWARNIDGLRTKSINRLDISFDGAFLYAATNGEGTYRMQLKEASTTIQIVRPSNLRLLKKKADSFVATWDKIKKARFLVDLSLDPEFGSLIEPYNSKQIKKNKIKIKKLSAGTYYLRVKTSLNGAESAYSDSLEIEL